MECTSTLQRPGLPPAAIGSAQCTMMSLTPPHMHRSTETYLECRCTPSLLCTNKKQTGSTCNANENALHDSNNSLDLPGLIAHLASGARSFRARPYLRTPAWGHHQIMMAARTLFWLGRRQHPHLSGKIKKEEKRGTPYRGWAKAFIVMVTYQA